MRISIIMCEFLSEYRVIRKDIDIIRRAFTAELIIPDFKEFKSIIDDLHRQIKANKSGTVSRNVNIIIM